MQIDNVMLYSGGMDSTVLLYKLKPNVKALMCNYGQRHRKEIEYARDICIENRIKWDTIDISAIHPLIHKGALSGHEPVPEGHYAEESMKATISPNRNMIILSIAVAHAIAIGARNVWYAAHAGDHAIYPDCRPEFVEALDKAIYLGNRWSEIHLVAPFLQMSKSDIVQEGTRYGVPFARTWSCYKGGELHCGKCGTCVERREAFQLAGAEDPTTYE